MLCECDSWLCQVWGCTWECVFQQKHCYGFIFNDRAYVFYCLNLDLSKCICCERQCLFLCSRECVFCARLVFLDFVLLLKVYNLVFSLSLLLSMCVCVCFFLQHGSLCKTNKNSTVKSIYWNYQCRLEVD